MKYYCTGEVLENGYLKCVTPEMNEPEFSEWDASWKTYLAALPVAALVVGGKTGWLDEKDYEIRYEGRNDLFDDDWQQCDREKYDYLDDPYKRLVLVPKKPEEKSEGKPEWYRDEVAGEAYHVFTIEYPGEHTDTFPSTWISGYMDAARKYRKLAAPVVEDRPKWVKASELPENLPDVVITMMPNGKVFAYDTTHTMKGLTEIRKHHPDILCLCVNKPEA